MDATKRYARLVEEPPSAKLVYKVLELDAPMTHGEIVEAAVLPTRTTSYALSRLREADIIEAVPCPSDPRKRNYRPRPLQRPADATDANTTDADTPENTSTTSEGTPTAPEETLDATEEPSDAPEAALAPGQTSD